ncbi:hypothetical protein MKZ38_002121 [Zalerion maritima]|uniref:Up-regulated during septation protein 1 domain-containing protein n=1 Tax=Zalerion maritima TaxID=339359 RepID=A0AAD5RPH4_9PEZI|nr:hypothetical protein MKZ38_002121 [Zalerion maritima]
MPMAHIVKCMAPAEPDRSYISIPSPACSQSVDMVSSSCNHLNLNCPPSTTSIENTGVLDHQVHPLRIHLRSSSSPSTLTTRTLNPKQQSRQTASTPPPPASEKPFVWRMQSESSRKYQLFPKERSGCGKSLDPEQAFAMVMGQSGEKSDKPSVTSGLRLRIREHNLNRRRKISVPDLGPMTTVQEVAMDSPTIPGRPPLHERSISAPGTAWKQHHLAECMTASPTQEEHDVKIVPTSAKKADSQQNHPLSPKMLAPLVIPTQTSAALKRQGSINRIRSGSTPMESSRSRLDESPGPRAPFTPPSASAGPKSAITASMTIMTASTIPTPISAPAENRTSPKPWERGTSTTGTNTPDALATPRAETEPRSAPPVSFNGHRRQGSETGSIMDRGRPRKRSDSSNNNGPLLKRSGSKRSRSAERRAFEQLPKGWKGTEAINMLSPTEVTAIHKQALGQASRFEVLRKDDVDNLSRELRHLDERTEYLRRTYTSLRAGRRNLHGRICQYLRSPRTAKFSQESILKQEEALAELDTSIDDWVNKLEQAENRRTRVRQKLLEHVAAAAILPLSINENVAGVSQSLHLAMGIPSPTLNMNAGNIATPPRSPTKGGLESPKPSTSSSPQRVVAQVPSTIVEQPLVEEAAALSTVIQSDAKRADVESIRVYAGSEVYALLQDVENEITKMSNGDYSITPTKTTSKPPTETKLFDLNSISEEEHRQLHRARSHEMLSGLASKPNSATTTPTTATSTASNAMSRSSAASSLPLSPPAPLPPAKDTPNNDGPFLLSAAVFQPEKSTAAAS